MSEWEGVQAVWAKNGVVANLRGKRWMHNTKVQKKRRKKSKITTLQNYKNQLCCFQCSALKQCLHYFNNLVQRWTEVDASQAWTSCKMHQRGKKEVFWQGIGKYTHLHSFPGLGQNLENWSPLFQLDPISDKVHCPIFWCFILFLFFFVTGFIQNFHLKNNHVMKLLTQFLNLKTSKYSN